MLGAELVAFDGGAGSTHFGACCSSGEVSADFAVAVVGDVGSACACAEFGSLVFSSGLAAFTAVLGVSSTGAFMLVVTAPSDWTIFDFAAESRAVSIRREAFAGFSGVYGDRLYAFASSANEKGFPFFTGRDQRQIIRYRARFRNPEKAARPINLAEAERNGANPLSANPAELMIDVETPEGDTPALREAIDLLRVGAIDTFLVAGEIGA